MSKASNPEEKIFECGCGRKACEIYLNGTWEPEYQIWNEGSDFGQLSMSPCCKRCYRLQGEEALKENYWEGDGWADDRQTDGVAEDKQ